MDYWESKYVETCYVYLHLQTKEQELCGDVSDPGQQFMYSFFGIKELVELVEKLRKTGVLNFTTLYSKETKMMKPISNRIFYLLEIRYFQHESWQGILHGCKYQQIFKSTEECYRMLQEDLRKQIYKKINVKKMNV